MMKKNERVNFIRETFSEISAINKETRDKKIIAKDRIEKRSADIMKQINIDTEAKISDNEKRHKEKMKVLQDIEDNIQSETIDNISELLKQI